MRRNSRAGVYAITNQVNGKFYIGSSSDIDRRWASHRHSFKQEPKYNSHLRSAVQKYGIENFTFVLVVECEPIKEVLRAREQHYIDTLRPEYNILPTAGSNLGFKQPPSFFEKRCGSTPWNKGIPMSDEQREAFFAGRDAWIKNSDGPWNKGVPMTQERREELEAAGFWEFTAERRQKMSDAKLGKESVNKGVPMSEEQKQALREIALANFDPDHQARITEAARQANLGAKYSLERCKAQGDGRRGKGSSLKGIARTENVKQKVSEALQTSEKAKAFHESRKGIPSKPSKSGHYGIGWRNDTQKWMVRIENKKYGAFATLEEAIARRDEVVAASTVE